MLFFNRLYLLLCVFLIYFEEKSCIRMPFFSIFFFFLVICLQIDKVYLVVFFFYCGCIRLSLCCKNILVFFLFGLIVWVKNSGTKRKRSIQVHVYVFYNDYIIYFGLFVIIYLHFLKFDVLKVVLLLHFSHVPSCFLPFCLCTTIPI